MPACSAAIACTWCTRSSSCLACSNAIEASERASLARAAKVGAEFGYSEVNLNVGCPSDRVKSGNFGACMMADPQLVAECMAAMREAVDVPVTVKHRIGIDHNDSYEAMKRFVEVVAAGGVQPAADAFTVHARKAWLSGLSPKENRTVPPLRYGEVHRLKRELPHLTVELNGGVLSLEDARALGFAVEREEE